MGDIVRPNFRKKSSNLWLLKSICIFIVVVVLCTSFIFYQGSNSMTAYELYPTQNIYTFLKLNTMTGQISQVQYSLDDDGARIEVPVNTASLVSEGREKKDRFKLQPTHNMYNFLLLDQVTGQVWQVQWHIEPEKRGIIREIKKVQ